MAKILPSRASMNLGGTGENAFDNLLKLLQIGSGIAGSIRQSIDRKDTSDANALATINKMLEQSNDFTDLDFANQYLDNIDEGSNDLINLTRSELTRQVGERRDSFTRIESIGNEIAGSMTSNIDMLDADGSIKWSKTFKEMSVPEAQEWFNSIKSGEGYVGQVTENLRKIKQYKMSLANTFGASVNAKGEYTFKKIPNIDFKDSAGNPMHATLFMSKLDNYEDSLKTLLEAGFGPDKILNYEETQHFLMGDYDYYSAVKKQRQEEFRLGVSTIRTQKNHVVNAIGSLMDTDDDFAEIFGDANKRAKFEQSLNTPGAIELFLSKHANIHIEGDAKDAKEQILNYMSSQMDKSALQKYYNEFLGELDNKEKVWEAGANAWGFGGYYGIYPDDTAFSGMFDEAPPVKGISSKEFITQFPFYTANADTLSVELNNPGNITFANQAGASKSGMFAKFETPQQGWKALYTQVEQDIKRGDTIETFIKGHIEKDYTDAYSKTDQPAYIQFLMQKLKVPKNTLLSKVDKHKLVEAIATQEGYLNPKTGKAPSLSIVNKSLDIKETSEDFTRIAREEKGTPEKLKIDFPSEEEELKKLYSELEQEKSRRGGEFDLSTLGEIRPRGKNAVLFADLSSLDKQKVFSFLEFKKQPGTKGEVKKKLINKFNNMNIRQQSKVLNQNLTKNKYVPSMEGSKISWRDL